MRKIYRDYSSQLTLIFPNPKRLERKVSIHISNDSMAQVCLAELLKFSYQ